MNSSSTYENSTSCGECQTNDDCRDKGNRQVCNKYQKTDGISTPECIECYGDYDCLDENKPFCNKTSRTCISDCTDMILDNSYSKYLPRKAAE